MSKASRPQMEKRALRVEKRALRRRILEVRDGLSSDEVQARSARIREALGALPTFRQARTVHLFVSFGTEVDTRPLFEQAWQGAVRTVVPRVAPGHRLEHCLVTGWEELRPGYRDIPEPCPECAQVPLDEIDLVVVPGVAFDTRGGRLGYGGGYYDRFLRECSAERIALAFSFQVVPKVPCESHDLPVHVVVTEQGVLRF